MFYLATFKIGDHHNLNAKSVQRRFPQILAGQPMTRQMMMELVLTEHPNESISITDIRPID
jgi:hypothetical protein